MASEVLQKSQEKTNEEKDKVLIINAESTIEYENYYVNDDDYYYNEYHDDEYHDEYLDYDITPGLPLTDLNTVNIFSSGLNEVSEPFSFQNLVNGQNPKGVSLESPLLVEQELNRNEKNKFDNAIKEFVDPVADIEQYDYVTENVISNSEKTFKQIKPPVRERNYYTSTPSNFNKNEPFLSFRDEFQFQFHNPKKQIQTMMTKILRQDDDIRINIVTASTQPQLK